MTTAALDTRVRPLPQSHFATCMDISQLICWHVLPHVHNVFRLRLSMPPVLVPCSHPYTTSHPKTALLRITPQLAYIVSHFCRTSLLVAHRRRSVAGRVVRRARQRVRLWRWTTPARRLCHRRRLVALVAVDAAVAAVLAADTDAIRSHVVTGRDVDTNYDRLIDADWIN